MNKQSIGILVVLAVVVVYLYFSSSSTTAATTDTPVTTPVVVPVPSTGTTVTVPITAPASQFAVIANPPGAGATDYFKYDDVVYTGNYIAGPATGMTSTGQYAGWSGWGGDTLNPANKWAQSARGGAEACANLCLTVQGCNAYTFDNTTGAYSTCWLQSGIDGLTGTSDGNRATAVRTK